MAKDLTNGNGHSTPALPSDYLSKLQSGIAESRAQTHIPGGKPFLRLLKSGEWVYGSEDIAVEEGSTWVVNLMTLAHGWCCWVDIGNKNELRGEAMDSMTNARPPRPEPIDGTPFAEQRAFELKCLDGEDAGTEVLYKTASVGGMRAVDGLLETIQKRLVENPVYCFPVLKLELDHYNHSKWGKTYVPIFDVVGWTDVNGDSEGKAKPRVKGPAPAAVQPEPEPPFEPDPAPAPAQRARSGQRTRPSR